MESRRRGKRKSQSRDIIFEVSDNDISPEPSDNECSEPEAKILKTDGNNFQLISSGDSNLESDKPIWSPKICSTQENEDNSVVIVDSNSLSNNSAIEICSNTDVIDITTDDASTVNVNVETCSMPNESSVEIIVDITEVECNPSPLKEDDFDLEEGELEDIANVGEDKVDSSSFATNSQPCICITFSDEKIAELYKCKFLKFIQSFVELEVQNFDDLTINVQRDCSLDPSEWVVIDETICISDVKELAKEDNFIPPLILPQEKSPSKKKRKKKNKKEKELFILDTNPSANEQIGQRTMYSTKFQIDSGEKSTPDETEGKISAQICFNCDSNHAIKDCPLPKNRAKINAARQKFKAQKQTARYHLEEDQKYGHLAPGKISDRLREALGLRKNQLPPFIYAMRILGYPPGWLEEAKFVHSNLELFDSEGNNVRMGLAKKKQGLDPAKIIDYPGFNVPPPKDVKDEHRLYRVPPYSDRFSKDAMIDCFEKQYAQQQDDLETCDMDLDSTFEEIKEKTGKVGEMVIVNPLLLELKELDSNMPSPSLIDLEKQKESLLAALEDNSSSNPKSVETAGDEPERSDCEVEKLAKVPVTKNLVLDMEKVQDSSVSFSSPPLSGGVNSVKTSMFGTPILKSSSPYSSLPKPDNFMKDVSPVINFENLPNSTGKYEQMTEVLQKVRNTLRKNLQNCKS